MTKIFNQCVITRDNEKENTKMKTVEQLKEIIENKKVRSAWDKGVNEYALELLDNIYNPEEQLANIQLLNKALLNGADNWQEYSWGGCA